MPTWITEYMAGRDRFAGEDIEAETREEAERVAAARTPPEVVLGECVARIPVGGPLLRVTDDGCCQVCGTRIIGDDHSGGAQA